MKVSMCNSVNLSFTVLDLLFKSLKAKSGMCSLNKNRGYRFFGNIENVCYEY